MENKPRIKGLSNLKNAGSSLQKNAEIMKEKEKEYSTENNIIFSFRVNKELIHYIKKFRIFKIEDNPSNHLYSDSDVVREGLQLLKETFPSIPQRPEDVEVPTKRGRGEKRDPAVIISNTSFTLSESDINFIYNFIFDRQKGGARYTKEEFLALLVEHLEMKFKINKK